MIDLLVVGGGPVGLAAAIRGRLAGLDVLVVEPRADPVDKACGEGLMPTAVDALDALGVRPVGKAFSGIRYIAPRAAAEARFRGHPGQGVRRVTLHAALAQRAEQVGVVREQARINDVEQYADRVRADGFEARWLLAADGLHSPTRRRLGLDRPPRGTMRFGHRRHYVVRPWSDLVEVYWSRTAEAYVTPVGAEAVGVALLCGRGRRYDDVLRDFPALQERLAGSVFSAVRAAGPLRQRAAEVSAGRVLLIGDAAGYVDALTGEGIATGLATAEAAVGCVLDGRPEDYPAAWAAATRRYRLVTRALLAASQLHGLRRQIVPAAERLPRVFSGVVNLIG